MAIKKIFPIADATLYSNAPSTNTGLDEMLEIGTFNNKSGKFANSAVLEELNLDDIRRTLIQFDSSVISSSLAAASQSVVARDTLYGSTSSFSTETRLRMFLATADNLTTTYTVEANPVAEIWANGLGKYNDAPTNTEGASWYYKSSKLVGNRWVKGTNSVTESFKTIGGGSWYTGYTATQSFNFASNKDLNLNVTNIITAWTTGSSSPTYKPNLGFIVKFPFYINYINTASLIGDEQIYEKNPGSYSGIKFYSMDTHTIYPPCLEIKWNDYYFRTSSNYPYLTEPSSSTSYSFTDQYSASVITNVITSSFITSYNASVIVNDSYVILCNNNLGKYQGDTNYRFNFRARDRYPAREFTTSSVYLDWKYLPKETSYAVQDYKTKEMAYDFDPIYTKLSIDENGSYFNLDMNGLQPERSYKILIKSTLQTGETIIKDNDIIFKVIR